MMRSVDTYLDDWIDEIVRIASIPAPSHEEAERARYVVNRLHELGYPAAAIDDVGNVLVDLEGSRLGPHIMFVAHMDTVFSKDVHAPARRDGDLLRGPSVADDSAGVVTLLALARLFAEERPAFPGRITLAMSVGEEGLGNLKGIRGLMDRPASELPDIVIAIDGKLGTAITTGIASVRFEVEVTTEGGHPWGDFGRESAIAIAAGCVTELTSLSLPVHPKTILNVGTFHGGIAVNAIASQASFTVGLRSVRQDVLDELRERVEQVFARWDQKIAGTLVARVMGERPGGTLPPGHYLYDVVKEVHAALGIETRFSEASTDANIPLSMGIPAMAIGVRRSANSHRLDEYLEIDSVPVGIKQLLLVLDAIWRRTATPDTP